VGNEERPPGPHLKVIEPKHRGHASSVPEKVLIAHAMGHP
jgi:hypothetical protein